MNSKTSNICKNNDPNAPAEIQRIVGKKIAARFRSWPKHLGATELTKNGVENHFLEFLDYLEEHFFEQYFTFSQFNLHFFLHVKGLPHIGQIFVGRFRLLVT